jgi:hypothetical protein
VLRTFCANRRRACGELRDVRAKLLATLIGTVAVLSVAGAGTASSQDAPVIRGPVTALRTDGEHLLIGQGSTLVTTRVGADDLQVIRAVDLQRHDLRAIAVNERITLVLSEDGLTTLNESGKTLDFVRGGGQRLAVWADRVYIAALGAGVRILKINAAGKLSRLGTFPTLGPAVDLAAEGDAWLWVAEGESGVRLYDTSNPDPPKVLTWLGDLKPATVIRVNGPRLIVGYGSRLSVLDTLDVRAPRLLSTVDLDADARVGDVLIQGSRAYLGRIESGGADVVTLDLSNLQSVTPRSAFGTSGAGEALALHGDDLFIGSGRQGLRRVRFKTAQPELVATWESVPPSKTCTSAAPVLPQPPNLGEVPQGQVMLSWKSGCGALSYDLRIDGTLAATVNTPAYTFTPRHGITTWQVSAVDAAGNRVQGPLWRFEALTDGWLSAPARAPLTTLLYTPPPVLLELRSPGAVLAATCVAVATGLLIVVAIAWAVGTWSERRAVSGDR